MHEETNAEAEPPLNTRSHVCIHKIVKISIIHIDLQPFNAPRRTISISHQCKS